MSLAVMAVSEDCDSKAEMGAAGRALLLLTEEQLGDLAEAPDGGEDRKEQHDERRIVELGRLALEDRTRCKDRALEDEPEIEGDAEAPGED